MKSNIHQILRDLVQSRSVAMLSLVMTLVGCGAPPVRQLESVDPQALSVTFVLPAPESVGGRAPSTPNDLASMIQFKNVRLEEDAPISEIDSIDWTMQPGGFKVERWRGLYNPTYGKDFKNSSMTYHGTFRMEKSGSNYQLAFSLDKKLYQGVPGVVDPRSRSAVAFSPTDVAANLAKAVMPWKLEVNSDFNTESSYANFARLTRKEVFRGSGQKDPVTGKIFKERFWIRLSGRDIPLMVETYPYRNGSKVIVYAMLPGTVSGNTVDFVSAIDILRKEIERIVQA